MHGTASLINLYLHITLYCEKVIHTYYTLQELLEVMSLCFQACTTAYKHTVTLSDVQPQKLKNTCYSFSWAMVVQGFSFQVPSQSITLANIQGPELSILPFYPSYSVSGLVSSLIFLDVPDRSFPAVSSLNEEFIMSLTY
jgi:hypothetical protein